MIARFLIKHSPFPACKELGYVARALKRPRTQNVGQKWKDRLHHGHSKQQQVDDAMNDAHLLELLTYQFLQLDAIKKVRESSSSGK